MAIAPSTSDNSSYAEIAFHDLELYRTIVKHCSRFNLIRGIDYALHKPETIRLIPPKKVFKYWQKDYEDMRINMIHEVSLSFEDLMKEIESLQNRINHLDR